MVVWNLNKTLFGTFEKWSLVYETTWYSSRGFYSYTNQRILKAELNLFKNPLIPKMKITLPSVWNLCRIGQLEFGREKAILNWSMSNFVTYSAEQQCTSVTFQSSSAPVPVDLVKGLALMHFSILQPMLLCGYTSAE